MSARSVLCLIIGLLLAGCVAPDETTPAVRRPPAASAPTPPRADLEPAPVPNRRAGPPTGNSVIRVQQ